MTIHDDDLSRFAAEGAAPLPVADQQGYVEQDGARIWYATYGAGMPVILLHGGLGHSGNWGYQVPALVAQGYQAVVIDSRGHGRSTRDARPFSYELMATDVAAVLDHLQLARVALVGWSDGACTALVLADQFPARVAGVLFFACNMDPSGAKEFVFTPIIGRCFDRHVQDYKELSTTPDQFEAFSEAVGLMQRTQPNYSAEDLAQIGVPVTIVQSELDEFIKREHAEYLAQNIPNAELIELPGVSHFAPLQQPEQFNRVMLAFLRKTFGHRRARNPMPADIQQSLELWGLLIAYQARPAYQQNDYLGWINRAKQPDTRAKRLAQMLDELERGGVYMNMKHTPSGR